MTKTKKRMLLCILLLCATLVFIWGNSLNTGTDSAAASGRVMTFIKTLLGLDADTAEAMHPIIRKIAHFTEFACLGMLLTWLHGLMGEKKGHLFMIPLLWSLAAACVDETIQAFVPDRVSATMDIWIDTCGAAAGIIILLLGYHYICKKQTNKTFLEETT